MSSLKNSSKWRSKQPRSENRCCISGRTSATRSRRCDTGGRPLSRSLSKKMSRVDSGIVESMLERCALISRRGSSRRAMRTLLAVPVTDSSTSRSMTSSMPCSTRFRYKPAATAPLAVGSHASLHAIHGCSLRCPSGSLFGLASAPSLYLISSRAIIGSLSRSLMTDCTRGQKLSRESVDRSLSSDELSCCRYGSRSAHSTPSASRTSATRARSCMTSSSFAAAATLSSASASSPGRLALALSPYAGRAVFESIRSNFLRGCMPPRSSIARCSCRIPVAVSTCTRSS